MLIELVYRVKNWMFYGSEQGGQTGAIWHSLMASAIRHKLNEYEYILDVLNRLSDLKCQDEIYELLPDRWKPRDTQSVS